jgi:hypothetical protein
VFARRETYRRPGARTPKELPRWALASLASAACDAAIRQCDHLDERDF